MQSPAEFDSEQEDLAAKVLWSLHLRGKHSSDLYLLQYCLDTCQGVVAELFSIWLVKLRSSISCHIFV